MPTIYCIGRNYAAHISELNNARPSEPLVFLKGLASLRGLAPTPMGHDTGLHYEVELVLHIGTPIEMGDTGRWSDISAVSVGLDLTHREIQTACKDRGHPWTQAKSFAGSAVVGPAVFTDKLDPNDLRFALAFDDETKQQGDAKLMLFDIETILTYLASRQPLSPGDLVFTGTPSGVGPIELGQAFTLSLSSGAYHQRWESSL